MKIWIVELSDYDCSTVVGAFSSEKLAEEARNHHFAEYEKRGSSYYSIHDYYIASYDLDAYVAEHLSPLAKALK